MRRPPAALIAALLVTAVTPVGAEHEIGHTTVFASVGDPGAPEGIVVRDGVVYVGTHVWVGGNSGGPPSKIFKYSLATGQPLGDITIAGQNLGATHGILAMRFRPDGLYVIDRNPPRMLRIDVTTGSQTVYATFPELDPCSVAAPPCSPTLADQPPFPDYLAFDGDGNAYVTDLQAATIFKVPAGGGAATVWFQDARLDSIFGPNGMALGPDGNLYFAMTGSTQPDSPAQGLIYRLPVVAAPQANDMVEVFRWLEPAAGPDGIAFGASGRLYVALAGANQVSVLQPGATWTEVARFPENPVDNAQQTVPYDLPASIAFDGSGNILVTNQSYFANDRSHWAVLRAWAGDVAP